MKTYASTTANDGKCAIKVNGKINTDLIEAYNFFFHDQNPIGGSKSTGGDNLTIKVNKYPFVHSYEIFLLVHKQVQPR